MVRRTTRRSCSSCSYYRGDDAPAGPVGSGARRSGVGSTVVFRSSSCGERAAVAVRSALSCEGVRGRSDDALGEDLCFTGGINNSSILRHDYEDAKFCKIFADGPPRTDEPRMIPWPHVVLLHNSPTTRPYPPRSPPARPARRSRGGSPLPAAASAFSLASSLASQRRRA